MNDKKENRPLEIIKKIGIFNLSDYEGSCCCLSFCICGVKCDLHCWRSNCNEGCEFSGIHISQHCDFNWNLQEIAEEIYEQITKIWSNTDWSIKYIDFNRFNI